MWGMRSCGALGLAFVAFSMSFGFIGLASLQLPSFSSLDFPCLLSAFLASSWILLAMAPSVSFGLHCVFGIVNAGGSGNLLAPMGFMWINQMLR